MKKSDSLKEMQYWIRESVAIIQWTEEEAKRLGYEVPSNFATGPAWDKAHEEIEEAVEKDLLFKTRDLCGQYVVRTVKYCKKWLEMQQEKAALQVAA